MENKYSLLMMDVTAGLKAVMATQLSHNEAQTVYQVRLIRQLRV